MVDVRMIIDIIEHDVLVSAESANGDQVFTAPYDLQERRFHLALRVREVINDLLTDITRDKGAPARIVGLTIRGPQEWMTPDDRAALDEVLGCLPVLSDDTSPPRQAGDSSRRVVRVVRESA